MSSRLAAGALIGMHEEPDLDPEEIATILTLERADWLGAVIGLVRGRSGEQAVGRRSLTVAQPTDDLLDVDRRGRGDGSRTPQCEQAGPDGPAAQDVDQHGRVEQVATEPPM